MWKYWLLIIFSVTIFHSVNAQFTLSGKVTNDRLEPLAFASVQIKGRHDGVLTKEDGAYSFKVDNGILELLVTMVGYKPQVVKIAINKSDYVQNIILEEDSKMLGGVTVKGRSKDRAEEYIRKVIKNKEAIQAASGAYTTNVYIKAVQEDSLKRKTSRKKTNPDIKTDSTNLDLQKMAMSEISLQLDYQSPSKCKEVRIGVANRGATNKLFYLTTTDGIFNLYDNLIKVPALSPATFVSPISYSGLVAYKYKTLKTEKKGNRNIYTISFKPGALSNATVQGEVMIDDSAWVLLNAQYSFPGYHLPEYDFFEVQQQYNFVNSTAWMVTQQLFSYGSKSNRGKVSGYTDVVYKNFELNKKFPKNYFGMEMSAASDSAYKRDSSFWSAARTQPLSEKELRFVKYKDSIYAYTHSKAYLDSIDRKLNKVTWQKILYQGQPLSNHEKGTRYVFPSAAAMVVPYLFSFGGLRIGIPFSFSKTNPTTKKTFSIYSNINYGFLNKDVNWGIYIRRKYNAFNQAYYTFTTQKEFSRVFSGDAIINQLKRSNYYLNTGVGGGWGREITNGLMLNLKMDMAWRKSLSGYKTYSFMDSVFSRDKDGGPVNKPIDFAPFNALYGSVELAYTPFQPYIREPNEKINLDSKWPTAYVQLRKGIPNLFNSEANFDYLEFGMRQILKLGTAGISSYTVRSGAFISKKQLNVIDYKWQRRGDPFLFSNPEESFQALRSTFPVFKRFYEGHYFHEFNGAILNKVPLLKRIGLREVGGAGFLLAPEKDLRYVEAFAGIERVFKVPFQFLEKFKLGFYTVGSLSNQFKNPVQYKIGITTWDSRGNKWR